MCTSRRERSNENSLAKVGVDTAKNEPLEVWGKIIQYYSFVSLAGIRFIESTWMLLGMNCGRCKADPDFSNLQTVREETRARGRG